jgi:hypothetical protein
VILGWRTADRLDRALGVLALSLVAVAGIRSSGWLVALCLLAAVGVLTVVVLRARAWPWLLLAGPALAVAGLLALPWVGRRLHQQRARGALPLVVGLSIGLVVTVPVAALLASADPAFADVLEAALPDLTTVPARAVTALAVAGLTIAAGYAACAPPRWPDPPGLPAARPLLEWAVPLALVDGVLAAFIAVQAGALFGGPEAVQVAGVTHAGRARQGFGQLVAVTAIVLLLLAWAGWAAGGGVRDGATGARRRDPRLAVLGGILCGLTLLVAGSALRRLYLYEQAYGWTVTRITAGTFEIWLGVVVVLVAVLWLAGQRRWLPRAVVASAAAMLLALAVAGPDALAGRWNVDRFERTGRIDVAYLTRLSDDAVPALGRLPAAERSRVLGSRTPVEAPWYAVNVARWRALRALTD